VAIATLSNYYFSETVRAIEAACAKSGLMMILVNTQKDPEQELKAVKALHERRVDGIVLASEYDPQNTHGSHRSTAVDVFRSGGGRE
jgi:LacI family transcriptional regulator